MAGIKSLAKETAVYGLSSIVGRFLNWCLVPLYVYIFRPEEYGIVSYLYSFTAVVLVILNYGMETGFFRFANKEGADSVKVYSTSLMSVGITSLAFILLVTVFLYPLSDLILLSDKSLYVWLLGVTVSVDAFSNIPFAYLRFRKKAFRFAGIKLANVGLNIALNLFFLLLCPVLTESCPGSVDWFYAPAGGVEFGIGWIFVANIISTLVVLLLLLPQIMDARFHLDCRLLRSMLRYSWPLLVLGVAGIMSQNMGQIVIPYLFRGEEDAARAMVGIYGANIKIAIVMVMFTQAFRYAYEPFIFAQARNRGEDQKQMYADAMKFFVIFGLFIFLCVMFFLPVLKHFVAPDYWSGLSVVPVMMMAELFFGVFFNLSLWYKLTDKTVWGMYFSLIGFVLMLMLNILLVPAIGIPSGYMGSAWAAFISYFVIMTLSWYAGRKYYPVPYEWAGMGFYLLLAAILWGVSWSVADSPIWLSCPVRIVLLFVYLMAVAIRENVPILTPLVRKFLRHRGL